MQRLHDSIQALYTKNKKSEEEYRRVCQQVYDLKSKYEPHEYEKELKEKEPSVMEYLIKCKNKLNEFQDKLIYNSEEISRFVNTVDKIYNQDHIKIAQLQKNSESSNVIAQRVVDFYRGYLSTYSLELSKVIIRKGGKHLLSMLHHHQI
jgi:predicted nuclease with TOPRIM domain